MLASIHWLSQLIPSCKHELRAVVFEGEKQFMDHPKSNRRDSGSKHVLSLQNRAEQLRQLAIHDFQTARTRPTDAAQDRKIN